MQRASAAKMARNRRIRATAVGVLLGELFVGEGPSVELAPLPLAYHQTLIQK